MTPKFSTRCTLLVAGLILSGAAAAQAPSQAEMQRMMAGMQAMQQCIAKIDQKGLQKLEQQGQRMQARIEELCSTGKRDEAQKEAVKYAAEMAKAPTVTAMAECTKPMQGLVPAASPYAGLEKEDGKARKQHVCDN
ncbi:DUF4175 domain-containing protein [Pseudothauera rhizosphaerae]|uniref:DUF4175 domain-containing protein n=1 Tax=Pseudothauera rhizosphaerae TaxID=2565932 RepID=A0A4S4AZ09_9RHOO|nr:DUF4175 domain-containing protein [Pseudothauera rhizosphaerae]THF65360.1 DUF4175 domain-containing protein [Pseudothauera rhizosphaerae]